MALNSNGEALFAIAGTGGYTGILLVRLNPAGGALTTLLRQESIVPRFLSALRYFIFLYFMFQLSLIDYFLHCMLFSEGIETKEKFHVDSLYQSLPEELDYTH